MMEAFRLDELRARHRQQEKLYLEFLRVPAMSMGLYRLPAKGTDPQQPHAEDEVYIVTEGKARIEVDGEDNMVEPGSIIYVPAGAPHRFHAIEEELAVLVVFAPAET